jgi:RNA ligase (TIGR02306 family)
MSEFKVPVVRVRAVDPIPDATSIELATVGDYRCVVQKERFAAGDYAVYLPEGALLPDSLLAALDMTGKLSGPGRNYIKAIKLRGCLSQGILLQVAEAMEFAGKTFGHFEEGDDFAELLGITKYDPPVPIHMAGEVVSMFGLTHHYDIENIKSYPDILQNGEIVEFTEKVHGTLVAITQYPGLEHVDMIGGDTLVYSKGLGQNHLVFKDNDANKDNLYIRTVKEFEIADRIRHKAQQKHEQPQPITIFGEIYGSGVQDLKYGSKKPGFLMFDMYIGKQHEGYFANRLHLEAVAHRMGLGRVPVLHRGPYSRDKLAEYTSGKTVAGNDAHIREGVVVTPLLERNDPMIGRVILKSISADYLLRKGNVTEFH